MKKTSSEEYTVPSGLTYLAALSWRFLAIAGVVAVFIFLIMYLKTVVIPFLVALLITALLYPLMKFLMKKGVKKPLAVAISIVSMIVVVSGLGFLVASQIRGAYPDLQARGTVIFENTRQTLSNEPFNISEQEIDGYVEDVTRYAQENSSTLASGALSFGSAAVHFITGAFLVLFAVIFMLLDGRNIWRWVTTLFPKSGRQKLLDAGFKGWRTLINFVKSQIQVAGVDAVGIGLGALILGVPLAIPIAVMVFLGAFIPVVGAIVTGALAVLLALIFNGWVSALLMLGVVLLVQLIESHVLQPFLIGKAVSVHPLAVILAVAVGALIAGIPGALFSVPIVAVLNVMVAALMNPTEPVPETAKTDK